MSAWSVSPSTRQSAAGALDAPAARRFETRPQPWGSPLGPCVVTRRFRGSSGGEEGPLLGSGGIASASARRRWERPPSSAGCIGPWRPARVLTLLLVIATPPVTGPKVLMVPVAAPVKPNREQRATPLRSPKLLPTSPKDSSKTFIGSPLPTQDPFRRFLSARKTDRRPLPRAAHPRLPDCSSQRSGGTVYFRGLVGKYVRELSARPREAETSGIWPFRELPVKPERHGSRAGEHRQHLGQKKLPNQPPRRAASSSPRAHALVWRCQNLTFFICLVMTSALL